jgi:threonine dehydratase
MSELFTEQQFQHAAEIVYQTMQPTLQHQWPLLAERTGCETWVKHENHTPTGAFKLRGGLVYMRLRKESGKTGGIVSATRGNHGQSLTTAGRGEGMAVTIFVPKGNSIEKNAAMQAQGATLIEAGDDFDEAAGLARQFADDNNLEMMPSFLPELSMGVSTYGRELFEAVAGGGGAELDSVYVPIGLGSGICSLITQRNLMGLKTKIIGVVSTNANAYALSFDSGVVTPTNSANTFADGMAVRVPDPLALEIICKGAERIVQVSDDEVAKAIRAYYTDSHNLAEGAGAASLAALMQEKDKMQGKKVGIILTGGNIDRSYYKTILAGYTPEA